jgi:hypothetical protein
MQKFILFLLASVLLSGCASIPRNRTDVEQYAMGKFQYESMRVVGKKAKIDSVFREFSKKCIPAQVIITTPGAGFKGLPGDHFIKFRTEIAGDSAATSLYIQKDIGSMANAPEGGIYFIWVKATEGNVDLYWMDSYGFRGPEILNPLKTWITSNERSCPDLKKDPDLAP